MKVVATLTPETAVPIGEILDQYSWAPNLKSPMAWTEQERGPCPESYRGLP